MVKKKDLIHFITPIPKANFFFTKFVDLWVEGRMVSVKSAGGVTV